MLGLAWKGPIKARGLAECIVSGARLGVTRVHQAFGFEIDETGFPEAMCCTLLPCWAL